MKKIPVFLVTGFLESGKTRFLQAWLRQLATSFQVTAEDPLVIHYLYMEQGEAELCIDLPGLFLRPRRVRSAEVEDLHELFLRLPPAGAVVVEYNGTWPLERLWKALPPAYTLAHHVTVLHEPLAQAQLQALGDLPREAFRQADTVLFTLPPGDEGVLAQPPQQRFFRWRLGEELPEALVKRSLKPPLGWPLRLAWIGLFFAFLWVFRDFLPLGWLRVFPAICLQILPFLLLSSFLSSLLQVFVREEKLKKRLHQHPVLSRLLAILIGSFLPICDCGLVPVLARLHRKGVKLSVALLLFFASTVTQPLVLASTMLAFPGRPAFVWLRAILGLALGLGLSSALAWLLPRLEARQKQQDRELALHRELAMLFCASGDLGPLPDGQGLWSRLDLVFRHTAREFLMVCSYVWPAAALGSFVSYYAPKYLAVAGNGFGLSSSLPWIYWLPLLLLALFLMAMCASSNAFVAAGLAGIFPPAALLLFLIAGPWLDLKNLLLFRQGFGPRFLKTYLLVVLGAVLLLALVLSQLPGLQQLLQGGILG